MGFLFDWKLLRLMMSKYSNTILLGKFLVFLMAISACSTVPTFYGISINNKTDSNIENIWLILHERDENYYQNEKYPIKGLRPQGGTGIGIFSPNYQYVPGAVTVYWEYSESGEIVSYSFNMRELVTDKRNGEFVVDVYDAVAQVSFFGKEEYYADNRNKRK